MTQSQIKLGDKVRITPLNIEGYLVKIYFDQKLNKDAYIICEVKVDAPPLEKPHDIKEVLAYVENLPKNIKTTLKCTTVTLDPGEKIEKI